MKIETLAHIIHSARVAMAVEEGSTGIRPWFHLDRSTQLSVTTEVRNLIKGVVHPNHDTLALSLFQLFEEEIEYDESPAGEMLAQTSGAPVHAS